MSKVDAGFDYHRYRQLLAEAVDEDKRRALQRVAREYSHKSKPGVHMRCDVVTVILGSPPRIDLFRDAVPVS